MGYDSYPFLCCVPVGRMFTDVAPKLCLHNSLLFYFLQNVKNKQKRTATNPPMTPHGLQVMVRLHTFSSLYMQLLLLTFFNNSFNSSFIHSDFPSNLLSGWKKIAHCSHTQVFLYLSTIICISPTGNSAEISLWDFAQALHLSTHESSFCWICIHT